MADKPYQNKAKRGKYDEKPKKGRTHLTGPPLTKEFKEQEDRNLLELLTKRKIENSVKLSVQNGSFDSTCYVVFAANYFAKSIKGDVFIPAEISLAEFSLKTGLLKTYHSLVNPKVLPYGNKYDAQVHCSNTHKLPLPPNALGEENLSKLYVAIMNFAKNEATGEYRPLYVKEDSLYIAKAILAYMKNDFNDSHITLEVYPIQHLFHIMKESACKIGELSLPSSLSIQSVFYRDNYAYHVGLSCEYHENIDRSNYCAKSIASRMCFKFTEYMAPDVAIKIIKGRHIPHDVAPSFEVIEPRPFKPTRKQDKIFKKEKDEED
ncbi:protein maelstrom-like [Teleopsis dalmanni]|uniref:protein maelstrom-like n=1 Tax=Teleopsis dalmanni TaxID=139649 RepID=UPI0018CFB41A|nr:protein maelstrom-like [Teleopsis dalmanni]XP_037950841.1 protein maelstrom-like [Teleopsis dalmanni]XP_037950842.1 protein maelstrom-like [Teleopsis dalmanni]XP_037950843.1 protein maelstrom-like [Teleopsis dalmanni]XP_037956813.1 protein maelstrom-like [Teleopsis dalmanni]XP_037956814.1 protein maelstrom-like [Teleopsis dalmanni]